MTTKYNQFIDTQELPFLISVDLLYPDNSSKRVPGDYGVMNYDQANKLVSKTKDGSRLPNNEELKLIHKYQEKIPNLSVGDSYWSSENSTEPDFIYGKKRTAYDGGIINDLILFIMLI